MPLVKAIAVRVHENLPVHVDLDDLVHAGVIGLFDAATKYDPTKQVVACGTNGSGQWGKYLLDVSKVQGTEVTSANAALSTTSNQWQVNLTLNSKGAAARNS